MKFYRVDKTIENGQSAGFEWFTTRREARKAERAHRANNAVDPEPDGAPFDAECTVVEVTPTKAGILAALNKYASHPDNG